MSVVVKDDLMAVGTFEIDLNYTRELWDSLVDAAKRPRKYEVLIHDEIVGGTLISPPLILLSVSGDEQGIKISGVGPLWWLGAEGIGPMITKKLYKSLANKLSNGDFELNVWGEPFLYWQTSGESKWLAAVGSGQGGSAGAAFVSASPAANDVLASTEPAPAEAGDQYYLQEYLVRAFGSIGHLWAMIVFNGRFVNPDLHGPYSGWGASVRGDIVLSTDPTGAIAGPTMNIRTAIPNLAANGSFDDGGGSLNGFISIAGVWSLASDGGHNGTHYMHTDGGPAWKEIVNSVDGAITLPVAPQSVAEGEEFEFWVATRINPGSPTTVGETYMMVGMTGGSAAGDFIKTPSAKNDNGVGNWQIIRGKVTVAEGRVSMIPQIVLEGAATGSRWDYDDFTVIKTKGNIDSRYGPLISVVHERTYRWVVPYRGDSGVSGGRVRLQASLTGANRPPLIITGPDLRQPNDDPTVQLATFDIKPPSGYTNLYLGLYSEDVTGGLIVVGRGTLTDVDTSTRVFGNQSAETYGTWTANAQGPITAPEGTDTVRVDIVAEKDAKGWLVDTVYFGRFGFVPPTLAQIFAELLTDLNTGLPLPLVAGTITAPAWIPHDWTPENITNREAWDYLCSVIANPPLVYRIIATDPGAINVGLPSAVFQTHDRADALLAEDMDVQDLSNPELNVETRATVIRVIGADRPLLNGQSYTIMAEAQVPGETEYDPNGYPIVRVKIVKDSNITHHTYAQAYADSLADQEATTPLALSIKLSGKATRLDSPPGDTLHVWDPSSSLEDRSQPSVEIAGQDTFPLAVKVLSRERNLGSTYRIELRASDGTITTLPNKAVRWSEDATVLTVGNKLPQWIVDL